MSVGKKVDDILTIAEHSSIVQDNAATETMCKAYDADGDVRFHKPNTLIGRNQWAPPFLGLTVGHT